MDKYDLWNAHMFVIEGMDKVRKIIAENRKRKLTKHKKISTNTIIEINHCLPIAILKLQKKKGADSFTGKESINRRSRSSARSRKNV